MNATKEYPIIRSRTRLFQYFQQRHHAHENRMTMPLISAKYKNKRLENRNKLPDKPSTIHYLTDHCHVYKTVPLHRKLTFPMVALCQCFIITDQCFQIFLIILRDNHIHKAATFMLHSAISSESAGETITKGHNQSDETAIFLLLRFKRF